MKAWVRWLAPLFLCLLWLAHARYATDRLRAQRLLWSVEARTIALVRAHALTREVVAAHLNALADAERLDPGEVGIPAAIGGQYFLLGQVEPARSAYRRARALERRPELLLNLGKLRLMQQERKAAVQLLARAVALDPWLEREVPEPVREATLDALRRQYGADGADEDREIEP